MKIANVSIIALTISLTGCWVERSKETRNVNVAERDKKRRIANPLDGLTSKDGAILEREIYATINTLAFSPDGKILASGGYGSTALWYVPTGTQIGSLEADEGSERETCVVFSHDGKKLAVSSEKGPIKIWDMDTKKETCKLQPLVSLRQMCFSADGKILYGSQTRCWDIALGKELKPLLNDQRHCVYSPDGECVATSGVNGAIVVSVLQIPSGNKIAEFPNAPGIALAVSMSAKKILCQDQGTKELSIWDFSTKKVAELEGLLSEQFHEVAVSYDGKYLAAAFGDSSSPGTLKVWEFESGKEVGTIDRKPTYDYHSVALSKDNKLIAAGSAGGIVNLWKIEMVLKK